MGRAHLAGARALVISGPALAAGPETQFQSICVDTAPDLHAAAAAAAATGFFDPPLAADFRIAGVHQAMFISPDYPLVVTVCHSMAAGRSSRSLSSAKRKWTAQQ